MSKLIFATDLVTQPIGAYLADEDIVPHHIIVFPEFEFRLHPMELCSWARTLCNFITHSEIDVNVVLYCGSDFGMMGVRHAVMDGEFDAKNLLIIDQDDFGCLYSPIMDSNARFDMSFSLINQIGDVLRPLIR